MLKSDSAREKKKDFPGTRFGMACDSGNSLNYSQTIKLKHQNIFGVELRCGLFFGCLRGFLPTGSKFCQKLSRSKSYILIVVVLIFLWAG